MEPQGWVLGHYIDDFSFGKYSFRIVPQYIYIYIYISDVQLHNVYSSPSRIRVIKSRRMRWAGHGARMGEKINVCRKLVGKPEGKRPLGRPRRRFLDIIKMDLREIGWDGVDWMNMAQDRDQWMALVNTVLSLRVP
jgi:hypothetical protein